MVPIAGLIFRGSTGVTRNLNLQKTPLKGFRNPVHISESDANKEQLHTMHPDGIVHLLLCAELSVLISTLGW